MGPQVLAERDSDDRRLITSKLWRATAVACISKMAGHKIEIRVDEGMELTYKIRKRGTNPMFG